MRTTNVPCPVSDQGKPAARRGRKARDLPPTRTETARLPDPQGSDKQLRDEIVKANLARFTMALALLSTLALTLGAGWRW